MEFIDITEGKEPFAGEYIYHVPTRGIVLCGGYDPEKDSVQVYGGGKVFRDRLTNFKKIKTPTALRVLPTRSCGGCKG